VASLSVSHSERSRFFLKQRWRDGLFKGATRSNYCREGQFRSGGEIPVGGGVSFPVACAGCKIPSRCGKSSGNALQVHWGRPGSLGQQRYNKCGRGGLPSQGRVDQGKDPLGLVGRSASFDRSTRGVGFQGPVQRDSESNRMTTGAGVRERGAERSEADGERRERTVSRVWFIINHHARYRTCIKDVSRLFAGLNLRHIDWNGLTWRITGRAKS
jgi:hypothetical protein